MKGRDDDYEGYAIALTRKANDPSQALNLLREYMQSLVLRSLHESEAFRSLAFVGRTRLSDFFITCRVSRKTSIFAGTAGSL
jgi:hypothetical protein